MTDPDRPADRPQSGTPPVPPPPPVRVANAVAPSGTLLSLANIARTLKIAALLLFLLPWVTVSCAEQTLVSMSGLDLATGSVTTHNPLTGETVRPPAASKPDWLVLVGALLILAALALSFLLRRGRAAIASIAALAAAATLIGYSVLVRLPARAREDAIEQGVQGAQGMERARIAELIRIETQAGFWLTLVALVAAIAVTWMAWRRAPPD